MTNIFQELTGRKGFITYKCNDKLIYSIYDPEKEAFEYLKQIGNIKKNVITFCGADYINQSLTKHFKDIDFILSVDPVPFPSLSLNSTKIRHVSNIDSCLNAINIHGFDSTNTTIIPWHPFIETSPDIYLPLLNEIKNMLIKRTLNAVNVKESGKLEIKNFKKNIQKFKRIKYIALSGEKILPPALVISSGNSLLQHLELIQTNKNKCIIFCYPSALKYLQANNIDPDYVISVDPGYGSLYHLYKQTKPVNIITTLTASPSIVSLFKDNLYFFNYSTKEETNVYKNTDCITSPPEGTVAFNTFSILKQSGFAKIILIGQDFGYFDQKSHIVGGNFEEIFISNSTYSQPYEEKIFMHENKLLTTRIHTKTEILKTTTALSVYYEHFLKEIHKYPIYILKDSFNKFNGTIPEVDEQFFNSLTDINKNTFHLRIKELRIVNAE